MTRWIPVLFLLAACGDSIDHSKHHHDEAEAGTGSAAAAAAEDWTCPMHPDVHQDHPGDCPKCGMHLEKN